MCLSAPASFQCIAPCFIDDMATASQKGKWLAAFFMAVCALACFALPLHSCIYSPLSTSLSALCSLLFPSLFRCLLPTFFFYFPPPFSPPSHTLLPAPCSLLPDFFPFLHPPLPPSLLPAPSLVSSDPPTSRSRSGRRWATPTGGTCARRWTRTRLGSLDGNTSGNSRHGD